MTAADFVPAGADLAGLRKAAQDCRGCELWEPATQTVFSAGPAEAPVVLVGEQPGDQEDRQGAPFVGPAGRLLIKAVDEAGLPRDTVYRTNAAAMVQPGIPTAGLHGAPTRAGEDVFVMPAWGCLPVDCDRSGSTAPSDADSSRSASTRPGSAQQEPVSARAVEPPWPASAATSRGAREPADSGRSGRDSPADAMRLGRAGEMPGPALRVGLQEAAPPVSTFGV